MRHTNESAAQAWEAAALRDTVVLVGYWLMKALLSPVFYVGWRVTVSGRHNVPRGGPVILAPNHTSFCDSFFLPLVLARRVTFVAKAEYFDSWKTAWFFRSAGQIPMRREGGTASERALAAARDVLQHGGVLGVYPEGTRSPDGRLYRGHTGVARLALQCGVPVVPVGITGTTDVQPIGSNMMRPFKHVGIQLGVPLDLKMLSPDHASDPMALRRVADDLMFQIRELTGQEYVNRYAKRHNVVGGSDIAAIEPLRAIPGAMLGDELETDAVLEAQTA
jgi:1-acyl-sn-glycerol-3-phosphate acyltransferase